MSDLELLRKLTKSLRHTKVSDFYRSETYNVFIVFFLSTEIFKKNTEIKEFLEKNFEFKSFLIKYDINLKDYLFKSRTVLVGRFIRVVQKAEVEDLKTIMKVIHDIAFFEANNKIKASTPKSDSKKNYYDSLLEQFKRG